MFHCKYLSGLVFALFLNCKSQAGIAIPASSILASAMAVAHTAPIKQSSIPTLMVSVESFSDSKANEYLSTDLDKNWIAIPQWLAGTWKSNAELVLNDYEFHTGTTDLNCPRQIKVIRITVLGAKKDRTGQIWHYAGTPYEKMIEVGRYLEFQRIEELANLTSSNDELVVSTWATITRMDKCDNAIIDAFKERTITTYSPLSDGIIQVLFQIMDYDLAGRPLRRSDDICIEKRIAPFKNASSADCQSPGIPGLMDFIKQKLPIFR